MQTVEKKKRRTGKHGRLILLGMTILLLAAILLAQQWLLSRPQEQPRTAVSTAATLYAYDADDVIELTIRRKGEDSWTVRQTEPGVMTLLGEDGFTLSEATSLELMEAACNIPCEAILSEDPAEYADHLAEYGLVEPEFTAVITYADGVSVTLYVGDEAAHDPSWRYMYIEGDDRLFAFGKGMVETLFISRDSLWDVVQPTIHKARIDQITLRGSDGSICQQWTQSGDITDDDALDRWQLTVPFTYPADAEAMSSLLSSITNLRLGAYVGPATEERLTECGFDAPRMTIELHMAAGTIGNVNAEGVVVTEDWPESTTTLIIGGKKNDMIDYVRYEDAIYISSHFTMGVLLDIDERSTMSRYPLLTALGNLSSLTIEQNGTTTRYEIIRTEQVAENNDLVYDEDGNIVYDVTCTRNGETYPYSAFEAAYNQLMMVTVSGVLPENEPVTADPHTIYTFTDVDGTVHTVALATFDVLHDAVSVDGHQAFYLIKDGFKLNLE